MDKIYESTLQRIDKNIAQNSLNFSQYGPEENLIRDLVIYMCMMYQSRKDLFGFMLIDPKKFAKDMNIKSPNFLFAHVEEPAQQKKEGVKKFNQLVDKNSQALFITRFENALYRMFTEPLILPNAGFTKEGNIYIQLDKIDLIRSVKIIYDKNNRNKKYYEIIPGEHLINNLSVFYTFFEPHVYANLKNRLRSFYLFLCNTKYNLYFRKNSEYQYTFDDLCKFLNINSGEPKKKKQIINNSFKEIIKTSPNFLCLGWENLGKWDYKPVFNLPESNFTLDPKEIRNQIFVDEYLLNVSQDFKAQYYPESDSNNPNILESNSKIFNHFKIWINDPNQGNAMKRLSYIHAGKKTWGDKFQIIDYKIGEFISTQKFKL